MNILLTGYTGNLGPDIACRLAPDRVYALVRDPAAAPAMDHVVVVPGTLEALPSSLLSEIEIIVHSAASTAFRAPLSDLRRTNVTGTAALLDFARRCPRFERFIHLSTTCVAGDLGGRIPEERIVTAPTFVNNYERSKWEAESLVLDSGLPAEIVRLSIVAGSAENGLVRCIGALHQTLYWLYHGLIPMLPGTDDSRVDLISTEFAAELVAAITKGEPQPGRIVHATSGHAAPRLGELLDHLVPRFAQSHRGWARGSISRPDIVDGATFALFEAATLQSGDVLFKRVCDDARSFLPGLLHAREFASSAPQNLTPTPWWLLVDRVFTWLLSHDWGRQPI